MSLYDDVIFDVQSTPPSPLGDLGAQSPELVGQPRMTGWDHLRDIAAAPLRGVEGLVKSVWNLADWATGDALIDYDKRLFGESKTVAGGLIEGITQFAVGWGTTGLALKAVARGIPALAGALNASGKAASLGVNMGKGAIVDFWAFEGDEGRLSDLVQKYPALQNPLTEFLSSDKDDNELEGRLKNTLEGLGMGAAVDTLVAASKSLRNVQKGTPITPEVMSQVDQALKTVKDQESLVKTREALGGLPAGSSDLSGVTVTTDYNDILKRTYTDYTLESGASISFDISTGPRGTVLGVSGLQVPSLAQGKGEGKRLVGLVKAEASRKNIPIELSDGTKGKDRGFWEAQGFKKEKGSTLLRWSPEDVKKVSAPDPTDPRKLVYKSHKQAREALETAPKPKPTSDMELNIGGETARVSKERAEEITSGIFGESLIGDIRKGGEVRSQVDKEIRGVVEATLRPFRQYVKGGMKGARIEDVLEDTVDAVRKITDRITTSEDTAWITQALGENIESFVDELMKDTPEIVATSFKKFFQGPVKAHLDNFAARQGGMSKITGDMVLQELQDGNADALKGLLKQQAMQPLVMDVGAQAATMSAQVIQAIESGTNPEMVSEFLSKLELARDLMSAWGDTRYLRGLGLRLLQENPLDYRIYNTRRLRESQEATLRNLKAPKIDAGRAKVIAEDFIKFYDPSDPGSLERILRGTQETQVARKYDGYKAWLKNNLLWNPATHIMNPFNNFYRSTAGSFERYLGAKIASKVGSTPEIRANALIDAEASLKEIKLFLTSLGDGLHAMKTTWKAGGRSQLLENQLDKLEGAKSYDPLEVRDIAAKAGTWDIKGHLRQLKAGTLNVVMPIHTMPGRALSSVDEGMKTMTYNAAAQAQAYARGRKMGLTPEKAEEYASKIFQEQKIAGSRMTSDKGYEAYAKEIATERILKKYEGQKVSELVIRDEISREQAAVYQAINPMAKLTEKAEGIRKQEKAGVLPEGSYEAFLLSPEYSDVDFVFKSAQEAERRALDGTFQTPLKPGGVVNALKRAAAHDSLGGAALSTVLPFISTPWNVVTYSVDTLTAPFKFALKLVRGKQDEFFRDMEKGLVSDDPMVQAIALEKAGRVTMGAALVSTGFLLTKSGLITGRRPVDPGEAAVWDSMGIQEYSFKVGNKYVSFTRLEPLGTIFGIMGDLNNMGNLTKGEEQGVLAGLAISLASNITEKTFLTSLSGVLEAVASGDERALNQATKSIISPVFANPGVAAVNRNLFDQGTVREMRTLADAIMAKTPGEAQRVDPRRNILGEVITRGNPALNRSPGITGLFGMVNPFYLSTQKNDPVLTEILTFGDVPTAPSPRVGTVDLRDYPSSDGLTSANDERNALIGTIKLGGMTLRERLEALMASKEYQALPRDGGTEEFKDPRYQAFQRVISRYREAALYETRRRNPELNRLLLDIKSLQNQINAGVTTTVDAQALLGR